MSDQSISQEILDAYELAKDVRLKSYSPYSNFAVGCAMKVKGVDKWIVGTNFENVSIGATICAERSAVGTMFSEYGKREIEKIVIVTQTENPASPCGLCLQVLGEFCSADLQVYLGNLKEIKKVLSFKDLLPHHFNSLVD